jgi:hypothetical protein
MAEVEEHPLGLSFPRSTEEAGSRRAAAPDEPLRSHPIEDGPGLDREDRGQYEEESDER